MTTLEAPQNPAGEYQAPESIDSATKADLIAKLAAVPSRARLLVESMNDEQLDTKYRNWTVRQIIHHLADSHVNCYVRFKWTLTESTPTIKAYDESEWSLLPDAQRLPIEPSLKMLEGVHARWSAMIELLTDEQLQLAFFHPESQTTVKLIDALPHYCWHADHHLAQIQWLKDHLGW